ncbi:zinc finger protein 708 [Octopus bimaculoides]|uniref:zinc finger protein 708 n=1 Tax=Octopus bimaculoides TaxID=37653 RepID=UPI0022E8E260|nr:zinc finger protein 708 [Octopus bimaculoides]
MAEETGKSTDSSDICEKLSSQKRNILTPKRTRRVAKTHHCDICGSTLTKHKRSHSGIKPFKCDICGKSFSLASHLNRHKLIHTGNNPYHCDTCCKSLSIKENFIADKKLRNVLPLKNENITF